MSIGLIGSFQCVFALHFKVFLTLSSCPTSTMGSIIISYFTSIDRRERYAGRNEDSSMKVKYFLLSPSLLLSSWSEYSLKQTSKPTTKPKSKPTNQQAKDKLTKQQINKQPNQQTIKHTIELTNQQTKKKQTKKQTNKLTNKHTNE